MDLCEKDKILGMLNDLFLIEPVFFNDERISLTYEMLNNNISDIKKMKDEDIKLSEVIVTLHTSSNEPLKMASTALTHNIRCMYLDKESIIDKMLSLFDIQVGVIVELLEAKVSDYMSDEVYTLINRIKICTM